MSRLASVLLLLTLYGRAFPNGVFLCPSTFLLSLLMLDPFQIQCPQGGSENGTSNSSKHVFSERDPRSSIASGVRSTPSTVAHPLILSYIAMLSLCRRVRLSVSVEENINFANTLLGPKNAANFGPKSKIAICGRHCGLQI